jgi:hypothetical protein
MNQLKKSSAKLKIVNKKLILIISNPGFLNLQKQNQNQFVVNVMIFINNYFIVLFIIN